METLNFNKRDDLWVSDSMQAGAEGKLWMELDFGAVPVNIIVEATADESKGTWARLYGQKFYYKTWGNGVSEVPSGMLVRIVVTEQPKMAGYVAS